MTCFANINNVEINIKDHQDPVNNRDDYIYNALKVILRAKYVIKC